MIRHWNVWDEGKRSHLFVADAHTGEAKDLTPKLEVNTPPAPFGGSSDYAWSPDGKELAFTAEPAQDAAWSTNTDIWTVPAEGGEPKNLTEANKGADGQPAYSPDGQWLAYVSQAPGGVRVGPVGAEGPSAELHGASYELTKSLDRPVLSFAWGSPNGDPARDRSTTWGPSRSSRSTSARHRWALGDRHAPEPVPPARHRRGPIRPERQSEDRARWSSPVTTPRPRPRCSSPRRTARA